ncbi:MAG: hypothetical protein BWX88_00472 [Planctomycetes bacterium ADurb.Bin126]|nr:MAG: hypothetical protein BWX88_00472 [Planctomycetes bacterium ADurb.Bin126]
MRGLQEQLRPLLMARSQVTAALNYLQARFSEEHLQKLEYALLRHVFLAEIVKLPGATTTKFQTRWCDQLAGDQRYCSFDECLALFEQVLTQLTGGWLDQNEHQSAVELFLDNQLLPYEVPVDYVSVPATGDNTTRIHRLGNLAFVLSPNALRTARLRKYLRDSETSPDAPFFRQLLDNKIKVKTYLTDRAQTGLYKTNREKRWEAHPHSVQFATRSTCFEIEYTLVIQLCSFVGFPQEAKASLQAAGILPAELTPFRCPVTLLPISFDEFRAELTNPNHGTSGFQVGHLTPLKLDAPQDGNAGHTADNISWISADGNRIQGSMSLQEVRALLQKIAQNYEAEGWT